MDQYETLRSSVARIKEIVNDPLLNDILNIARDENFIVLVDSLYDDSSGIHGSVGFGLLIHIKMGEIPAVTTNQAAYLLRKDKFQQVTQEIQNRISSLYTIGAKYNWQRHHCAIQIKFTENK